MVLVDSKKIKRVMMAYFHHHKWDYYHTITDVELYRDGWKIKLIITTHRPGILIGRSGKFIDGLKEWIDIELDHSVEIEIKESKLWLNLYK